ncbi:MAG: GspH/FimT family pseudopilin [Acidobacteria bacterium]|nr:GspH/FimT family pseudopilin [Acidobacteriota bacterium]
MTVVSLSITVTGIAVPMFLAARHAALTAAAARYLGSRCAFARMEAVKRSRAIGFRFDSADQGYRFALYADGNRNGIRTMEITSGTDGRITEFERLSDLFGGVTFGIAPGVEPIDSGEALEGNGNPIRIGRTTILTFTALGTASSGTLYLLGRGPTQYAVRVLGATGRTRVLEYRFGDGRWISR